MSQPQFVLNRLPVGLITLDRQTCITGFSGVTAGIFGHERLLKVLGQPLHSIHPGESADKIEWLLRKADDETTTHYATMLINMPDTVLQLRIVKLTDAQGACGYCAILYDITELAIRSGESDVPKANPSAARQLVKLPVSTQGHIALLDLQSVAVLQADGHYTNAESDGKTYFCSLSLSQLQERLPPEQFLRVHRSYIVNVSCVDSVHRRDDNFFIMMAGEAARNVPVGRSNLTVVRERLGI